MPVSRSRMRLEMRVASRPGRRSKPPSTPSSASVSSPVSTARRVWGRVRAASAMTWASRSRFRWRPGRRRGVRPRPRPGRGTPGSRWSCRVSSVSCGVVAGRASSAGSHVTTRSTQRWPCPYERSGDATGSGDTTTPGSCVRLGA
ncbi:hypothetical protein FHS29_006614 [Saccharothrix tamanrassetensis]|uniref:Uncharacterized protein n=1 Tax=Saccharothrix tamanrassetensis TaxID=1051531 RepID=A0A841CNG0_9PSEU|nr:hypothetical protein [Saccharothrix tamanrassetensis]